MACCGNYFGVMGANASCASKHGFKGPSEMFDVSAKRAWALWVSLHFVTEEIGFAKPLCSEVFQYMITKQF
jgi:hypothetical protein